MKVLVGVVATMLLLSGCATAIPMPEGPDVDVSQSVLDATWDATGLADSVERPVVAAAEPTEDWAGEITACLANDDITLTSISGDGVQFTGDLSGEMGSIALQLAWYTCFAQSPPPPITYEGAVVMSDDELGYLWDYYHRWVTPCLRSQGYEVELVPKRDEFVASGGLSWNPYWEISGVVTGAEYTALVAQCGDPMGMLAGR